MLKVAVIILASLVIATPTLAQQSSDNPICESVTDRTLRFRQVHLDRYSELVKAFNNGRTSDKDLKEMQLREKIVDEAYDWLKLLSYSSANGYTSNCLEIHFKLRRIGY